MDFLQRNLFTKLRSENFGTQEELEAMTTFKKKKIAQMMKNLNNVPSGEVLMHNSFLNRRLNKIQKEEPHVIDTSMETVYLLRLIVSNANTMLSGGISIRGIIQLGHVFICSFISSDVTVFDISSPSCNALSDRSPL